MTSIEKHDGYPTSFSGLFAEHPERPPIQAIRIPIVQRDYAQGRPGPQVEDIRNTFLDALHAAVTGSRPVGLDFVYGDVKAGTLLPLDGQQRLTTLFLLHWFICVRAGHTPSDQPWSAFTYDTRPSARRFCERLVEFAPPSGQPSLHEWITDQPWFLHGWEHDPTIQSMLRMLAAIEDKFGAADPGAAWYRLTDPDDPAVSFLLLPIEEVGAGDELYIKMNSRGKPLTAFENFKARLERLLDWDPKTSQDIAHKIDGSWSNLLWPMRGDDDIVDDEFLRYFEFIIEACEWRQGLLTQDTLLHQRAAVVFGEANERSRQNLEFLQQAFDVWKGYDDIEGTFTRLFTTSHTPASGGSDQSVVLFGTDVKTNLLAECCRVYGDSRGNSRVFSLSQTLLLYAVLQHRIHTTPDFANRLRVLRNLLAASEDEVRRDAMPKLIADVDAITLRPTLDAGFDEVSVFTKALVSAEREKQQLLATHPDLAPAIWRLEDHNLLRGSLGAIEFDDATLATHAGTFGALFDDTTQWPAITAALLACGDYQRRRPKSEGWQFGTGSAANDGVWRTLFAGSREDVASTRRALAVLMIGLASTTETPVAYLTRTTGTWRQTREAVEHLDWRYYLATYDVMRSGESGIYFGVDGQLGYRLCMLRRTYLNSLYRDPFLLAVVHEGGLAEAVDDPWFTGHLDNPRWMRLQRSGTGIRTVTAGYEIDAPLAPHDRARFDAICDSRGDVEYLDGIPLLRIPQNVTEERGPVDTIDRVRRGAQFLTALVDAGL